MKTSGSTTNPGGGLPAPGLVATDGVGVIGTPQPPGVGTAILGRARIPVWRYRVPQDGASLRPVQVLDAPLPSAMFGRQAMGQLDDSARRLRDAGFTYDASIDVWINEQLQRGIAGFIVRERSPEWLGRWIARVV